MSARHYRACGAEVAHPLHPVRKACPVPPGSAYAWRRSCFDAASTDRHCTTQPTHATSAATARTPLESATRAAAAQSPEWGGREHRFAYDARRTQSTSASPPTRSMRVVGRAHCSRGAHRLHARWRRSGVQSGGTRGESVFGVTWRSDRSGHVPIRSIGAHALQRSPPQTSRVGYTRRGAILG